jgi:phage tail sheath protein FI
MPEYLSPGVYVEEIQTGPRPIEGVGTSTAGMAGVTERGPISPRLITSWLEYQRWYGGYLDLSDSYLPYAVQGFFDNGGQRLFLARIAATDALSTIQVIDDNFQIQAVGPGEWGNRIAIRIREASQRDPNFPGKANLFRVEVIYFSPRNVPPDMASIVDWTSPTESANPDRRVPDVIESFDNLTHEVGAANNAENVVNSGSQLIRAWFMTSTPGPVTAVPGSNPPWIPLGTQGADGTEVNETHFKGDAEPVMPETGTPFIDAKLLQYFGRSRGLTGLEQIDEIALLAMPDEVRWIDDSGLSPLTTDVINQCEKLRDRFALVSADRGLNQVNDVQPPRDTSYAGFYYPWIEIYDPVSRGPILVPPTGHIMSIFVRTDIERGVFKAPANEVVRDATNPEFKVTKGMQDILNPRGVNCIRDFRSDGRGIRLWGARTMSSDAMWKYVNVRRLFIFIEESIDEGTQWVVFEPNDEPLWANVRRSISSFLFGVWRSGALMGVTPEEAFFVKCDRTTMTQDDIDNGRLICYIGVAPVKPAEFVIFRISQKTAEAPV